MIETDIVKLLKAEGFKINDAIKDALDEFMDIVSDENEALEEGLDDDEEIEDNDD